MLGDYAGQGSSAKYISGDGKVILGYVGSFGPATLTAVTAFQEDNGCWQDGEITAKNKTWRKLLGME